MDATARTPLRLALATGLFDDASMYPPSRAPMEAALSLHRTAAMSPWAITQGRFLCPGGQLRRLADERALLGLTGPLEVGAVVGSPADPGAAADLLEVSAAAAGLPRWSPGVRVAAVEVRPADPSPRGLTRTADEVAELAMRTGMDQAAIEIVVTDVDADEIDRRVAAVAEARDRHGPLVCAKVRCGGPDPSMVPTPDALAVFVVSCAARRVPFKATAGLHHGLAVAEGPERRHGYLAVVAAAAAALDGADVDDTATLLTVEGPDDVAATEDTLTIGGVALDVARIDRARRQAFLSFGTCSFTEPLADLLALT